MGLLLQNLGVPLDDAKERAAIYLTNALTGWEPPSEEAKKQLTFAIPEFKQEKEAADEIKQEKRIIVILGNPPYNGFAGLAVEEERELSDAYRTTKLAPAPQGQGLNDLYVRFFRMAERRIVEKSGEGIISFISNYSWLDGVDGLLRKETDEQMSGAFLFFGGSGFELSIGTNRCEPKRFALLAINEPAEFEVIGEN